ncbi:transaldolase [Komagataeibacter rhaeticus]|uniref:transaldolase n=1 Tax=Komagataeibacter rhaeticus TaxID=215221 RepID=UPI000D873F91|nr:transaldolase [Komagataeibacter rhaeticus]MBL7241187.1 transaldolase [Komagataeibacter rhaeticus]PYD53044.1 transaldolase [Komagataeibacter rhaeticus]GBQ09239.1 transaldolase [Komagataeibacter rhaeticus DSM 16663]
MNESRSISLTNPLCELARFGQSPWLDFIQRSFTENGSLKRLVDQDGLKGVTSNPAIFHKAIGQGDEYDTRIGQVLAERKVDAAALYEILAVEDIQAAAKVLYPVYETSRGIDGYVSLEVSPHLAHDAIGTLAEARHLWKRVDMPNLMIKIPGTQEGVEAVRTAIADGMNVNVTLLFSLEAYKKVLDAYMAGLEARHAQGLLVSGIASVASFFVSRIDARIDTAIDERIAGADPEAKTLETLRGKVAIANARMAYQYWQGVTRGARWRKLAALGAQPQRLLWASTGTKDPAYSDVLYVDALIGPETVNTIPPATFAAFREHGTAALTLTQDIPGAIQVLHEADRLGLDLAGVTDALLHEGLDAFAEAFRSLRDSMATKITSLSPVMM